MIAALLLAVTASAGCGTTPPATGTSTQTGTVDGDGTSRSFDLQVPAGYSNATPYPLIFVYHEAGGTAATVRSTWGYTEAAGASAIIVTPQGILWQGLGPGWDGACAAGGPALPGFSAGTGRDVAWFDTLVAWVGARYCVDLDKVYAAGFSWGADMTTALACCRGNTLAGVAIASATDEFVTAGTYTTYLNYPCSNPAAVRWTHDASDSDGNYPPPAFATTRPLLRTMNGCSTSFATVNSCDTYSSCSATGAFLDCQYASLGHARPANWAADTWSWFQTRTRVSVQPGLPAFLLRRAPPPRARPTPLP